MANRQRASGPVRVGQAGLPRHGLDIDSASARWQAAMEGYESKLTREKDAAPRAPTHLRHRHPANKDIITIGALRAMKGTGALVATSATSNNEIQIAQLRKHEMGPTSKGPAGRRDRIPRQARIILPVGGRLVIFGNAMGHPSVVMSALNSPTRHWRRFV